MARPKKKANLEAARSRMYRELVFESAERVFGEQGFEESSMQDLAAEAGVSLKTLYATIPGKAELYREIQFERGNALMDAVQSAIGEAGSPLQKLERGVRAIVGFFLEHPSFFQIMLRDGHAWGLNPVAEESRETFRAGTSLNEALIREGMDDGTFFPGDPYLQASAAQSLIQVYLSGLVARQETPDARAISDEIVLQLRRLLCRPDAREQREVA
jgi:AcrR family transcriptional regulator